jgi:beta-phosphoglucomutase-like phosphatase (HAD superfamily)
VSETRALILDCDGVLADTELDGHLVAFNQAFEEHELPFRWTAEEYAALLKVGGGKERLARYLSQHAELSLGSQDEEAALIGALHVRKSQIYVELVERGALPARPGVKRLVTQALDAGWQVAVASTSAIKSVETVLRSVIGDDLIRRISGVYAGDIVPAKKPAPDIYLLALKELGRTASEAVVIEDSEAGAMAAACANLRHLVTVSHFTVDDPFPHAETVVSHLGDPGEPGRVLKGAKILNQEGLVDVQSLERVLGTLEGVATTAP